ncbi:TetR family transcriptional regulator [Patulibacter sp. SYSU D01012]|uniref:TetR/AcrR family transcriptional regulator n=1 Tax=Patulibacter sp. SYSU D01012 TaxID=2817381 RepID=UPI0032C19CF3
MSTANDLDVPPRASGGGDGDDASGPALGLSRETITRALAELRKHHAEHGHPDEGLRERKKRLTRQAISDTATWLFCERGFDAVRVSEVAEEAGVSEKTVFNYFPTKESLVFDREEEVLAGMRRALLARPADVSPIQAMLGFIEEECRSLAALGDEFVPLFRAFVTLVDETPALRTAHRAMTSKLVDVAREALAERAGVDPRDPEPYVAAKALVSLWDLQLRSRERHLQDGTSLAELQDRVLEDTRRAARLLDTGLWSFNSMVQGARTRDQFADAAAAANEARVQVLEALRQAKTAWMDAQRAAGELGGELGEAMKEELRAQKAAMKQELLAQKAAFRDELPGDGECGREA